jgi:hypothetical protein
VPSPRGPVAPPHAAWVHDQTGVSDPSPFRRTSLTTAPHLHVQGCVWMSSFDTSWPS